MKNFTLLKHPSSWRRLSIATWKAPNNPTVYGTLLMDFTKAQDFLRRVNQSSEDKITATHFVAKAIALTLKKFPDLNGIIRWGKIYQRNTVDIFFQVAIPEEQADQRPDLSGAKVESCDEKSLGEIARELREKSEKIRTKQDPQFQSTLKLLGKIPGCLLNWALRFASFLIYNLGLSSKKLGLPPDPFGSAMVTNVGPLKLPAAFAPLVPMSRVPLIVCVGTVTERPWVVEGVVVVRPILDFGITFDHRFMDGLTGSRMVKYFQEILENPEGALEGE